MKQKKLTLNKRIIVNLEEQEMNAIKGGVRETLSCTQRAECDTQDNNCNTYGFCTMYICY